MAQGAANGIFRMFGDGLAARNGATGGNDIIQLGDRIGSTMGDVYTVGVTSAVDYRGGADEMLGLVTNAVQYAYGDAGLVYGGSKLTGGNDTILIQSASSTPTRPATPPRPGRSTASSRRWSAATTP